MDKGLDNLTAQELNEAIDDRNFPRPTLSASASLDRGDESLFDDKERPRRSSRVSENGENGKQQLLQQTAAATVNGHGKWQNRPKPLDLNGIEKPHFSVPGSSQTPRTSTTPGIWLTLQQVDRVGGELQVPRAELQFVVVTEIYQQAEVLALLMDEEVLARAF